MAVWPSSLVGHLALTPQLAVEPRQGAASPLGSRRRAASVRTESTAAVACAPDLEEGDGNRWFLPNAFSLVSCCVDLREDVVPEEETISSFCTLSLR